MHGECFHDQLAFAAGLFVVDDRATATHGQAALADPAALGDLLAAHGAANDAQDSRAFASPSTHTHARGTPRCSHDRALT